MGSQTLYSVGGTTPGSVTLLHHVMLLWPCYVTYVITEWKCRCDADWRAVLQSAEVALRGMVTRIVFWQIIELWINMPTVSRATTASRWTGDVKTVAERFMWLICWLLRWPSCWQFKCPNYRTVPVTSLTVGVTYLLTVHMALWWSQN